MVAIATFLMAITCVSEPAFEDYEVVSCVCAQERNVAGAKTVLGFCWRSSWILGCFGAFARRWRLYMACTREKEGWGSSGYVYVC